MLIRPLVTVTYNSMIGKLMAFALSVLLIVSLSVFGIRGANAEDQKILLIDSNQGEVEWSERLSYGVQSRLLAEDIKLEMYKLDMTPNADKDEQERLAKMAREQIMASNPDVVLTSSELAAKYVITTFPNQADIPFVVSGMHGRPEDFSFPGKNVTGIIEVAMIESLIDLLKEHSTGPRVGLLSVDTFTGRKKFEHYKMLYPTGFTMVEFAAGFDSWKSAFASMQAQVDLMILVDPTALEDWDKNQAAEFIAGNLRIPVGATDEWVAPYALITIASVPEEQGWWAADMAAKLISGTDPAELPVQQSTSGKLMINIEMAQQMDIVFPSELLQVGTKVEIANSDKK